MTNSTQVKTVSIEEYENAYIDDNPSKFHAMYNPITPITNPHTDEEKKAAQTISNILQQLTPFVGKKIYIGKEGRCHYFLRPEEDSGGIRVNCLLSISATDL